MKHPIASDSPGMKLLLLGNEAIARGAIEGGVEIAASYPGTPASEIVDTLALVAEDLGIYVEWSVNEKVAWEVAIGGALMGKRSIASMKHVGVNWVIDPLIHCALHGFKGGLVLISADDPSGHSSATEQDNRYVALLAEIPVLEPSNIQEAKDFTALAFEISEELRLPVMVRSVTRISHSKGSVVLGKIYKVRRDPSFHDDYYFDFVLKKGFAGANVIPDAHKLLHEKLAKAEKVCEKYELVKVIGSGELGIVASSVAVSYALDAVEKLGIVDKVSLLKVGMSYPLLEKSIAEFLADRDFVLVVEEGEPFIEKFLAGIAKDVNPKIRIYGKLTGHLPREGELKPHLVTELIAKFAGVDVKVFGGFRENTLSELTRLAEGMLTPRIMTFCAGCPHRATYFALKRAIKKVSKGEYVAIGDIGCYTLGMNPPFRMQQAVFGMGGSIGVANGVAKSGTHLPVIATIGDSTFYHAGIPALINAVFNQSNVKVLILDNEVTAMTGFQPHPGSGETAMKKPTKKIVLEDVVRACGVDYVKIVDPYDLKKTQEIFEEALKLNGPAVIIARRLCAEEYVRRARREGIKLRYYTVNEEKCTGCRICLTEFGCPAIFWKEDVKKAAVNPTLCMGCGVCAQLCPTNAFEVVS